jgi:hypothetical protein
MNHQKKILAIMLALGLSHAGSASAVIAYDQNVTNNAIFGTGNGNGSYTVDTDNNVELGLRGKLRHNASGFPEDTFNSNSDGTYNFSAGVAPTQTSPTAVWSFEWSINSDQSGVGGKFLSDFTYLLGLDSDPTLGTSFASFDLMDPANNIINGWWDHSIGDNSTAESAGTEATDLTSYLGLIDSNNLAQNSWKPSWFIPGFDPTLDATYNIYLAAFDGGSQVARSDIQIIVGAGGASVPEPSTLLLFGLGILGLGYAKKKRAV